MLYRILGTLHCKVEDADLLHDEGDPDDEDPDDEDDLEKLAWEQLDAHPDAVTAEVQTLSLNGARLAGKLSKIQYCQVSQAP